MKDSSKVKFAKRCAGCLVLAAIAAAVVPAIVEGGQSARQREIAQPQFDTQVQYHYAHLPVGHIEQIFVGQR
jgi:cell division septation protein DedD